MRQLIRSKRAGQLVSSTVVFRLVIRSISASMSPPDYCDDVHRVIMFLADATLKQGFISLRDNFAEARLSRDCFPARLRLRPKLKPLN